jgi:16S rRNA (cytosine967-C5)-methyltransferase
VSTPSRTDKVRASALTVLHAAERGSFADPLLEEARRQFNSRDNAFIHELVYGVLRNRSLLDWTLDHFSKKSVASTDAWTRNILRLAAYQLVHLDRVPPSAAVNTATELAKEHGKKSSYVNGLLRTLERERDGLALPPSDNPLSRLSIIYSHPAWLVRRWLERFGIQITEDVLRNNNRHAPLTIRANREKGSRDELISLLEAQRSQVRKTEFSPDGVEILSGPAIASIPVYQGGWFMVQDEAAQLVSLLLSPQPGDSVLDACAAPGGKAAHLAELMRNMGIIVALDSDRKRIGRISENSMRLGLSILKPVLGDAGTFKEGPFDKVLIDAPCSGLGVLRRHPDGRWSKTEDNIKDRAKLQGKILENCAKMLRPGGVLVYSTCTTETEENEDVVYHFLARNEAFALDDPRPHLPETARRFVAPDLLFRTFPNELTMDGFFGARIVRSN